MTPSVELHVSRPLTKTMPGLVQERMQRNRESAHQSRQRKKMQVEELSQRCDGLQQQNTYLSGMNGTPSGQDSPAGAHVAPAAHSAWPQHIVLVSGTSACIWQGRPQQNLAHMSFGAGHGPHQLSYPARHASGREPAAMQSIQGDSRLQRQTCRSRFAVMMDRVLLDGCRPCSCSMPQKLDRGAPQPHENRG